MPPSTLRAWPPPPLQPLSSKGIADSKTPNSRNLPVTGSTGTGPRCTGNDVVSWPGGATMKDPGFERALSAEILASELIRVQVLAATLAVLFTLDVVLFGPFHDLLRTYATRPLPTWLPVPVIGPFLASERITILPPPSPLPPPRPTPQPL